MPSAPARPHATVAAMPTQEKQFVPAGSADSGGVPPRIAVVLRIEWFLLVLRYLLYLFAVLLHVSGVGLLPGATLAAIAGAALLHNAFSQWVLHTRRHWLYLSPVNFLLYLGRTILLVAITGGDASPLAPLFLLFLIGCNVYAPGGRWNAWLAVAVCAAYSFTIIGHWMVSGIDYMAVNIYTNLALLGFCGWIMHQLSKLLRQTEVDATRRARELLSSEATLRTILDNTAEPIVVYGENEFVAEANRRACAFFGLPREGLVGRRFREFLFDDGLLPDRMDATRRAGEFHDEMLVVRPDSTERNVDMNIHSFIRDRRRFYVAMFRDITEQKDLEEAQRQAKHQLETANRELQRVNALRDDFYSTVTRRLRSPLTAILGFTDMLLDEEMGELGSEQRGALQSSRRSARRVLDMVDDAFDTAPTVTPQDPSAVAAPAEPGVDSAEESA